MAGTSLEELLRASAVHNGSIALLRLNGGAWRATVSHHNGHMVHLQDDWHDDPVEALRLALIEDARLCEDLGRRYAAAPKFSSDDRVTVDPDFDAVGDMEDLLG